MNRRILVGIAAIALFVSGPISAGKGAAVVKPRAELAWTPGKIPGVSTATVEGDTAKGPSHFYLKYAAGLVTPLHHHSADHYVSVVAGDLVIVADGKETRVPPGSYFAFTGGAPHIARCEGNEDCVMFLDARGAWDVVPEAAAKP
jgi:quercetin dioxygenase-like cupin family protein